MGGKNYHIGAYARMWPREVFDRTDANGSRRQPLVESLQLFDKPGVYVLYRDDVPYYVAQATRLRRRIRKHASQPGSKYYEGVLIAPMPTANGAKPRLPKEKFPRSVVDMMRGIRRNCANPR